MSVIQRKRNLEYTQSVVHGTNINAAFSVVYGEVLGKEHHGFFASEGAFGGLKAGDNEGGVGVGGVVGGFHVWNERGSRVVAVWPHPDDHNLKRGSVSRDAGLDLHMTIAKEGFEVEGSAPE